MNKCKKISCGVSVALYIILIAVGIAGLATILPNLLEKKLNQNLPIRKGEPSEKRFISSAVPTYTSFYIFNVTNKHEANKGEKVKFEEVGPYVYRQYKIKIEIKYSEGLVSYKEVTNYTFEANMSKGSLNDSINHVNVVSIGLVSNTHVMNILSGYDSKLKPERLPGNLVETHTVDELLFGGHDMRPYLNSKVDMVNDMICNMYPKCQFSFYGMNNNSLSKEFLVESGTNNLKSIGKIITYSGKSEQFVWYGKKCDAVVGSDGRQFSPGVNEKSTLDVFSADVCRSFKFVYQKEVQVQKIKALRFVIPPEVFEDPNKNKDNMCFCPRENEEDECPFKGGVFSIQKCKGKPIAMSAPHFYLGEQEYVDNFLGLEPIKEKHQTYLDVEPLTGTVISAAKRLQINLIVQPGKAWFLRHVNKTLYFPAMWVQEGAEIDKKSAEEFRKRVTSPYNTGKLAMKLLIGGGTVALLLSLAFLAYYNYSRKNRRELEKVPERDYEEKRYERVPSKDKFSTQFEHEKHVKT